MRGRTLAELRTLLKGECGIALSSANVADDVAINLMLSSRQNTLALDFDWPFLEQRWDLDVPGGTRFIALPTKTVAVGGVQEDADVNFDRPVKVETFYNEIWTEVEYGIGIDQYNEVDSEHGDGPMDPIRRWRVASNLDEQGEPVSMIEVWPIPATAQTLRFYGRRLVYELFPPSAAAAYIANSANFEGSLNARTALDAYVADLDDLLLVHTCAAEKLLKLDQKNAQIQAGLAKARLLQLKATSPAKEEPIVFGDAQREKLNKRLVPMILIHG